MLPTKYQRTIVALQLELYANLLLRETVAREVKFHLAERSALLRLPSLWADYQDALSYRALLHSIKTRISAQPHSAHALSYLRNLSQGFEAEFACWKRDNLDTLRSQLKRAPAAIASQSAS